MNVFVLYFLLLFSTTTIFLETLIEEEPLEVIKEEGEKGWWSIDVPTERTIPMKCNRVYANQRPD